jgi:hypothetical protein
MAVITGSNAGLGFPAATGDFRLSQNANEGETR